jgi:glucose/galactose transporter
MTTNQKPASNYLMSVTIIGILFFIFGFVTWLNGPLITFAKYAFNLTTDTEAFWITFSFYISYFALALPSSWILEKTGMKKGMAFGLLVMAFGTFLFGQFATARNYPMALLGLFVIGSGMTLLQTASNPYISIIGPIESAAQRISIMGFFNKGAGILSPIIIGAFVLTGIGEFETSIKAAADDFEAKEAILTAFASKVYLPYMVMAVILVGLSVWILKSALPEIKASEFNAQPEGVAVSNKDSIFQFPHLWLGALCIFLYVGAEVMAGDAIGTYGRGFNISADEAKYFTSFTLAGMLVGYVIGLTCIPKFISQQAALKLSAFLGIALVVLAYLTTGYVSVMMVALLGLANAMMWPAIFPLGISGLGKFTEKGSAILIMGISGGAIVPLAFGKLKETMDFQLVFLMLMLPCYLYILYYSMKGHKAGKA